MSEKPELPEITIFPFQPDQMVIVKTREEIQKWEDMILNAAKQSGFNLKDMEARKCYGTASSSGGWADECDQACYPR